MTTKKGRRKGERLGSNVYVWNYPLHRVRAPILPEYTRWYPNIYIYILEKCSNISRRNSMSVVSAKIPRRKQSTERKWRGIAWYGTIVELVSKLSVDDGEIFSGWRENIGSLYLHALLSLVAPIRGLPACLQRAKTRVTVVRTLGLIVITIISTTYTADKELKYRRGRE